MKTKFTKILVIVLALASALILSTCFSAKSASPDDAGDGDNEDIQEVHASPSVDENSENQEEPKPDDSTDSKDKNNSEKNPSDENGSEQNKEPDPELPLPEPLSFENALFIGDSRTVGLNEYGGIKADFFSDVGMSVYNINQKPMVVRSVGSVWFKDLLEKNQYDYIFVMLGINEVGYEVSQTVERYGKLIDKIREAQPDAIIFIQANLHVSQLKNDSHPYIKNATLNKLNEGMAKFADNKTIFYMDVNPLFDDDNGTLAYDNTGDGAHLYAKLYKDWADWIAQEAAVILRDAGIETGAETETEPETETDVVTDGESEAGTGTQADIK